LADPTRGKGNREMGNVYRRGTGVPARPRGSSARRSTDKTAPGWGSRGRADPYRWRQGRPMRRSEHPQAASWTSAVLPKASSGVVTVEYASLVQPMESRLLSERRLANKASRRRMRRMWSFVLQRPLLHELSANKRGTQYSLSVRVLNSGERWSPRSKCGRFGMLLLLWFAGIRACLHLIPGNLFHGALSFVALL